MSIPTKASCFYSHKSVAFIGRWQKEHYSSIRSRYQADTNLTSTQICCSVALYWWDMCTSCWPRWLVSDGWLVLCVPVSVYLCLCPCVYVVCLDDREGVHAIEEQPAAGINNSGQAQTNLTAVAQQVQTLITPFPPWLWVKNVTCSLGATLHNGVNGCVQHFSIGSVFIMFVELCYSHSLNVTIIHTVSITTDKV